MTAPKSSSRSRRRGWREWLFGAADEETQLQTSGPATSAPPPERIGHYRILRKLGQGGMGVVYEARDERLGRTLAIKTVLDVGADETARRRFWREARAAASVNHPHICQLYEIGEEAGELFIAMERLEGESLADRLKSGPLGVADVIPLALEALSALGALHARGIVHRDLKPSNVFLTPHGVKLLDFGLARSLDPEFAHSLSSMSGLTQSGMLVGTPRYMAPEQVSGQAVSQATDLFALGAILFEALAGRPAFAGRTAVECLYATLHEQPPALSGGPAVAAVDRVIRRALAKAPEARPATAEAMAAELRAITLAESAELAAPVRAITRLIVLPFRMLRADAETDFLSFGLADAIASSLVGPALLVRSSAAAARFASEAPDLKRLAAEADVDLVLTGSLLRAGDQLRVTTQLVEAPSGTLVRTHQAQAPLGDVFALQDELARGIVESFAPQLSARDAPSSPDVPKSARAYEFYLRGNEVGRDYHQLRVARDLYLRCVEEDPGFAPAWARLGRCHRVIGKYMEDADANQARAEQAFRRALELNPSLPIAHKLYAHLEAEQGRAREAMLRLAGLAHRTRNDPELFAGLVLTCRYCGLLDASRAAHAEARRLDPHVPTSVAYTLWQAGDYEAAAKEAADAAIDSEPKVLALEALGRRDEAFAALAEAEAAPLPSVFRAVVDTLRPLLEGRQDETLARLEAAIARHRDPEAIYLLAHFMARLGRNARALELLEGVVAGGFWPARALAVHPVFAPLRSEPAFIQLQARAEAGSTEARAALERAGGDRLLGL